MQCPACKADDDKVIDSRPSDDGAVVRRRRECNRCAKRFTTYERLERTARLVVVKRDGTCVPFEIENIMRGIQAACGKRPVTEAAKLHLAQEVDDELHAEFDREVKSDEVGKRVAKKLRALDKIAYVRFASEYHGFRNLEEFAEEIRHLLDEPPEFVDQSPLFDDTSTTP